MLGAAFACNEPYHAHWDPDPPPGSSTSDSGAPDDVPGLLGVEYRGPWMHDGSETTLEGAIDSMLAISDPGAPEGLDAAARADLVAFLRGGRPGRGRNPVGTDGP